MLKTTVDEEAMTLTTDTDQLSIWTVVVNSPSSSGIITIGTMEISLWMIIGGAAGIVVIIGLMVYFLAVRRRRAL